MYRTDRIYVSKQHEMFPYFDGLAHKAKNLYNASLFRIRNTFTAHDKVNATSNEKEVLDELALLKGQNLSCSWIWSITETDESYSESRLLCRFAYAICSGNCETCLF